MLKKKNAKSINKDIFFNMPDLNFDMPELDLSCFAMPEISFDLPELDLNIDLNIDLSDIEYFFPDYDQCKIEDLKQKFLKELRQANKGGKRRKK